MDRLEISDVVVDYDVESETRRPIIKAEALARLDGQPRAQALVRQLPDRDGVLDGDAVEAALFRAHCELQRLSEEFQQGGRVREVVAAMLVALRGDVEPPLRVVDVGCGLGYVIRWLAARGQLGGDVELIGCDFNAALVRAAQSLADREGLPCRFVVRDAFSLEQAGHVFISSGVLHHFRGADLAAFFAAQDRPTTRAFFHFDIARTWLAPFGAWLFHRARMREPLARHDGVLSAIRAHDARDLAAACAGLGGAFTLRSFGRPGALLPILRVMTATAGVRPEHYERFERALGRRARLLEPLA